MSLPIRLPVGFRLIKEYILRGSPYWELSKILENIPVKFGSEKKASRKLLPIEMRMIVRKLGRSTYELSDLRLYGHPTEFWHPNIGTVDNKDTICWGEFRLVRSNRSFRDILEKNMQLSIALLTNYTQSQDCYSEPETVLEVYTVPLHRRRYRVLEGNKIEALPIHLWSPVNDS